MAMRHRNALSNVTLHSELRVYLIAALRSRFVLCLHHASNLRAGIELLDGLFVFVCGKVPFPMAKTV